MDGEGWRRWGLIVAAPSYPLILNLLKDEPTAAKESRKEAQPLHYVIPIPQPCHSERSRGI